ncbi:MAG: hypothetical protein AB1486_05350 [Planctomycetota bacterium]
MQVLLGENEAIARDYMKHYRSSVLHVLDFKYESVEPFEAGGWPTYVVVDAQGLIVEHAIGLSDNAKRLRDALERVAGAPREEGGAAAAAALARGIVCKDGICYVDAAPGEERPVREENPELAAGADGSVWLTYASQVDGDSNIYLRRVNDSEGTAVLAVTRSMGDDYAPDLAVQDDGTVWVTWVSNREGNYDIYARARSGAKWAKEERITRSDDDAMSPAIAVDGKDRVWVTYTKWNRKMGPSRDRDIFARYRDSSDWSAEILVSPAEPAVEDHSDPDICADPSDVDSVWVAWSYDYHPSLFKQPEDADQPTIFAARVGSDGVERDSVRLVGTRGESLHAIDLWPSLATDPDGTVWCAFDAAEWRGGRGALLSSCDGARFTMAERVVSTRGELHSPRVCIDAGGTKVIVWTQREEGHWRVLESHDAGEGWTDPRALLESEGDLRSPVMVSDAEGNFWLACEEQKGREVRVRVERVEL